MNRNVLKIVAGFGVFFIFVAFVISQVTTDSNKAKAEVAAAGPDWTKVGEGFRKDLEAKNFDVDKDIRLANMVDWSKNPVDHRGGAFGKRVETPEELTKFLNGSSAKSKAARTFVLDGVPKSERKRALDGDNYVPVQFLVDIDYSGNSVYANGDLTRGGDLTAKAGDVFWVFVGQDNKRYWKLAIRADCVNPGLHDIPEPRDDDDDDDSDDESDSPRCPRGTVPYMGRCVKPARQTDRDGAGGDESRMKQDVDEHRQGDSDDDDEEPPPADRDDDDDSSEEHGSSGDGGAGDAEGPSDESHSDDETTEENEPDDPFED